MLTFFSGYFIVLSIILLIKLKKVINRNNYLEYRSKVLTNDLMTFAKLMNNPKLIEEFEEKMKKALTK